MWALFCVIGWYSVLQDMGNSLSLGGLFGFSFPQALAEGADDAAQAAFAAAQASAQDFWFYQYMLVAYGLFCGVWLYIARDNRWAKWSVVGSALIVFITWFQVQVSVMLNEWYGGFYDLIQNALGDPGSIGIGQYYAELSTVAIIIMVAVAVAVFNRFFVSHVIPHKKRAAVKTATLRTHTSLHYTSHQVRYRNGTILLNLCQYI